MIRLVSSPRRLSLCCRESSLSLRLFSSLNLYVNDAKNNNKKKLMVKKQSGERVDLDQYIRQHKDNLTKDDVVTMFLESSKHKIPIRSLSDLVTCVKSNSLSYDANALSVVACGLQLYNDSHQAARKMLSTICDSLNSSIQWTPKEAVNVLFGLQSMSSKMPEVRRLLSLFLQHVKPVAADADVSAKMISKGIFSLKNMSSDDQCTREILSFHVQLIGACNERLNEQSLSQSLCGLQEFNSNHHEVRELLSHLVTLIQRYPVSDLVLQPNQIIKAFLGIRRMNCTHEAVADLLRILMEIICNQDGGVYDLNPRILGCLFLGIQNVNEDNSILPKFLNVLHSHIESCDSSSFSELSFVNMFFGMQNMSSNTPGVVRILEVLTRKLDRWIREGGEEITLRGIATCLYGLKGMSSSHSETIRVIRILRFQLDRITERYKSFDLMQQYHLLNHDQRLNSKTISMASGIFQNMDCSTAEVRRLLKTQAEAWTVMGGIGTVGKNRRENPFRWDTQASGNVLYNLRNMSNEYEEVRQMLDVVWAQGLSHFAENEGNRNDKSTMSPLTLSNSLYGLNSMTSEFGTPVIGKIIDAIAHQLEINLSMAESSLPTLNCNQKRSLSFINLNQMCVALYGIRGCTHNHSFSRRIISLSCKVFNRYANEDMKHLGNLDVLSLSISVLGIQSMSNDCAEIRDYLQAVSWLLNSIFIPLPGDECHLVGDISVATGNFLYGLQAMALSAPEVNSGTISTTDTLSALITLIEKRLVIPFSRHFTIDSLQRSLYGIASVLHNSSDQAIAASSRPLLNIVEAMINCDLLFQSMQPFNRNSGESEGIAEIINLDSCRDVLPSLNRSLNLLRYVLSVHKVAFSAEQDLEKIDFIISMLDARSQQLNPLIPSFETGRSVTEGIFFDYVVKFIEEHNLQSVIDIQKNKLLHGFSTDITLIVDNSPSENCVYNIEIDGSHHKFPVRQRFMKLRDTFLQNEHGIEIHRIDIHGVGYKGSKLELALGDLGIELNKIRLDVLKTLS